MIVSGSPVTQKEYKLISQWLDARFYYSIGITFFFDQTQVSDTPWHLLRLYNSKLPDVLLGVAVLAVNGTCFWLPEETSEAGKLGIAILDLRPRRIMTTSFGRDLLHSSLTTSVQLLRKYDQWAMINSNRFPGANGRLARLSDIPCLVEYQYKYNEERFVEEISNWEILIAQEKVAVYEINGQIVSIVRFGIETNRIVTLGGTYTFPCYRRQGFAERVLEFAIDRIVSKGRIAHLIVDIDNYSAVELYLKMGFECVGGAYVGYPEYIQNK